MTDDAPATFAELVLARADDDTTGCSSRINAGRGPRSCRGARARRAPAATPAARTVPRRRAARQRARVRLPVLGAGLAGAAVVGINPTRRGAELARDIRHTDCQLIVTDDSMRPLLDGLDLGIARRPHARRRAARVRARRSPPRPTRAAGQLASVPAPDPETLFVLIFTSGSTGAPKAVRMTQGRAARAVANQMLHARRRALLRDAAAPRQRAQRESSSRAALAARRSRCAASSRRRSSCPTCATLRRHVLQHRRSRAVATSSRHPESRRRSQPLVKFVLGPESSPADVRAFRKRFGIAGDRRLRLERERDHHDSRSRRCRRARSAARRRPRRRRRRSGRRREEKPRAALRRARPAAQREPRRSARLVSRNARRASRATTTTPRPTPSARRNGWYWSGDLGYRDEDGVFYFAGRNADWIRVDGENFAAAPIERILARLPGVDGVAVYAVPDSRTGDQVMAAIETARRRRRSTPTRSPRSSPSSPTSARSGRRATSASSRRCPSARPTRSTSARCAPNGGTPTDPVFWRRAGAPRRTTASLRRRRCVTGRVRDEPAPSAANLLR